MAPFVLKIIDKVNDMVTSSCPLSVFLNPAPEGGKIAVAFSAFIPVLFLRPALFDIGALARKLPPRSTPPTLSWQGFLFRYPPAANDRIVRGICQCAIAP